ncbi:IQ domain-containing protein D-like isoform X2 [Pseudomyrmex gracilis]|nr:IQ domain-containing protein D-like isoform X2 [Pseudomyrmex gracilis]
MKRTPEIERMHIVNSEASRAKTAELLSQLEVLQRVSEEQTSTFDIFFKNILTCINNEEEIVKSIRKTSERDIEKEIENSIQEMLNKREQQEARKKQLLSEINTAERKLRDVIEFNATTEKELYEMCAKVEQEYKELLGNYDRDIGACHALTERLSKDYEFLEAEIGDIKNRLATQRIQYTQFKQEREVALIKAFNEKVELFKQTRATKIIQRTWRAYYERIFLKKRRKTKKKK